MMRWRLRRNEKPPWLICKWQEYCNFGDIKHSNEWILPNLDRDLDSKGSLHANDKLPSWASQLISKVLELEARVIQLQCQFDSCKCCQNRSSNCYHQEISAVDLPEGTQDTTVTSTTPLRSDEALFQANSNRKNIIVKNEATSNGERASSSIYLNAVDSKPNATWFEVAFEKPSSDEEIYRHGTRSLERTVQSRVMWARQRSVATRRSKEAPAIGSLWPFEQLNINKRNCYWRRSNLHKEF